MGEGIECHLSGGMLRLAQRGAVVRALEDLSVEVNRRFEARRVIGTFPNARVRREVEAASLCQLLKLVFVHFPLFPSLCPRPNLTFSLKKVGPTVNAPPNPDPIRPGFRVGLQRPKGAAFTPSAGEIAPAK